MHPTTHAAARPDQPAIIMAGSGRTVSFGEMDAAANRVAHLFRAHGIGPGDAVGLWLENRPEYLEIAWGNQRAGTTIVPISTHLTADEVAYILADSGATLLISSAQFGPRLEELKALPFAAVWDFFCARETVPVGFSYIDEIRSYEKQILVHRS